MRSRNCCCYAHNATNSRSSHYCNWQSTFLVKLQQSKLTPEVNTGMVFRHPHKAYVVHIYIYIYAHTHTHTHTTHCRHPNVISTYTAFIERRHKLPSTPKHTKSNYCASLSAVEARRWVLGSNLEQPSWWQSSSRCVVWQQLPCAHHCHQFMCLSMLISSAPTHSTCNFHVLVRS
jgi:hypothetical protein